MSTLMEKHYEKARSIIKIASLLSKVKEPTNNIIKYNELGIIIHDGMGECIYYNHEQVINFKSSWGNGIYDECLISSAVENITPFDRIMYSANINSYNDYDFIFGSSADKETFLFQMSLVYTGDWDSFCVLYALKDLGYNKNSFIYLLSQQVYDIIVLRLENIIENQ